MEEDRRWIEAERTRTMLVPDSQAKIEVFATFVTTETFVEAPEFLQDVGPERSVGGGKGVNGPRSRRRRDARCVADNEQSGRRCLY